MNSLQPVRIVINADDLGYSATVNRSIQEALDMGRISSATILANGHATTEAIAIAAANPTSSFGVHLNLTEFEPLLPAHELRPVGLVSNSGELLGEQFRRLRPSRRLLQACYDELDCQIQHLISRGLQPSHFDSHHHIHTVAWLFPVIWKLMVRYRLFRLRNTMDIYSLHAQRQPSRRLLAAKRIWRLAARTSGASMTDHFTSFAIFLENPYRESFSHDCRIELMCHPGQEGFEKETLLLLSGQRSPLPDSFQLTNYRQILA